MPTEDLSAANAGVVDVATSEGTATPTEVTTEAVATEPVSTETQEATTETTPEPEKPITETQAFAKRLKEERERIEREVQAKFEAQQAQKQAERDAKIAAQNIEWNGKKITTEADYEAAFAEKQKVEALQLQGYTEEAALLKIENDKLKAEKAERETAQEKSAREAREQQEFFAYFKDLNGRTWSPETDPLPDEVWAANVSGVPLKYAYADHFAKQQLQKQKGIETGKKTAEANASNATTTTGSVTGNGAAPAVITQADIDAHANDTAWMYKHYNEVQKVLQKKKG